MPTLEPCDLYAAVLLTARRCSVGLYGPRFPVTAD